MPDYVYGAVRPSEIDLTQQVSSEALSNLDALIGGVPVLFSKDFVVGDTDDIPIQDNDAPFDYRIIDAWVINRMGASFSWKLDDGDAAHIIAEPTGSTGSANSLSRATKLYATRYNISAGGSLHLRLDAASTGTVFVHAVRIS